MSLLIYALESNQIVVVTDTLATTPSGDPFFLTSKCIVMPHLEMVVVYLGIAPLGQQWSHRLQTKILARSIDQLDYFVTPALQALWVELQEEFGDLSSSATVYHFGYSESRKGYVGFAYRSDNDFTSEQLQQGSFCVKPAPSRAVEVPSNTDELVQIGRQVRSEQDERSSDRRISIGGELWMTVLANRSIVISRILRFEDFEVLWLAMNDTVRKMNS